MGTRSGPGDPTLTVLAAKRAISEAEAAGWDAPCPTQQGERVPSEAAIAAEEAVREAGRAAEQHLDRLAERRIREVIGDHPTPAAWIASLYAHAVKAKSAAAAAAAVGDAMAATTAIEHKAELVQQARTGLAEIHAARRDALTVVQAAHGVRIGAYRMPEGHAGVAVVVAEVGRDLPATWVERSSEAWPSLTVEPEHTRGSYSYVTGRLTVGADGDSAARATASMHELGHRVVATTPVLQGLSVTHHYQRVVHNGQREPLAQLPGQPDGEEAEVNAYGLAYCGRRYLATPDAPGVHDGAELLPIGLQALLHGDFGGLRGDGGLGGEDARLRHWTLGCLLTLS